MSSKIDDRVVQMKFNSGEFKKGVSETTKSLDSLKEALDMSKLNGAAENISSNFNAFGAIAFTALQKLTGSAMAFGQQIAGAVLDPLIEGGKKRALNIEQAKFQFKGLGMDVQQSMDDALYAVRGTAFGLDEAAVAASQFGASGIQSGAEMQAALRGISGVAAMAGSSYTDMASVFTKVAGQGRLMGDDLNRMGARGINAAAELGKAMGKTEEEIRAMVSKGQIDFKTFATVMSDAFGEHATKANETYTGSLSNMNAAIARIGASFATIDFESQRRKFNALTPAIDNFASAIKPAIQLYEEFAIAGADAFEAVFAALNEGGDAENEVLPPMFEALKRVVQFATDIIRPIRDAFSEVFPSKLPDTVRSIASAFEKMTQKLVVSEDAAANIKMVATALFTILKFGVDIISGVVKVVGFLIGFALRLAAAIGTIITPIVTFIRNLLPVSDGADKAAFSVGSFFDMLVTGAKWLTGWIITAIEKVGSLLDDFLNGGEGIKRIEQFKSGLDDLGGAIQMVWNVLTKGDFTKNAFFSEDSKFVDILFNIREGVIKVVDAFKEFFKAVGKAGDDAKGFWSKVGEVIKNVWGSIQPVVDAVKGFFGELFKDFDLDAVLAGVNAGVLIGLAAGIGKIIKSFSSIFKEAGNIKESFIGVLDELGGALGRFQEETKADKLIKIAIALGILAAGLWVLSTIDPPALIAAVTAMATAFGILLGGLYILDKIDAEPSMKASASMALIAIAVSILASAVAKLAAFDAEQLAGGLAAVAAIMIMLVYAAQQFEGMNKSVILGATAMVIMAVALNIMAGAVALFGIMPMEMLIQGMISITLVLGLLVGAAVILSKFAPQMILSALGLMAMAAAINMLIAPLAILGVMPIPVLIQGFIVLIGILGLMVGVSILLSSFAPQMAMAAVGMMAMAVAINLMVLPIFLLGSMDINTLVIGLAAMGVVLLLLVIAANAMITALPGAAAMIVVAAAVLIMSAAMAVLAAIGLEGIIVSIFGLVVALAALGIASLLLTPAAPIMLTISGALGIFALAMIGLSVALLIGVLAIMLLGPALLSAVGGLKVFAASADEVMAAAGPLAVLGAALLAFGAGALIAAVGVLLLGAGLILLGAGLALVSAVGLLGAKVLEKVALTISDMLVHIPGMLAMGGAFVVLGGGALVLGAGLLLLAAGALLTAVALMMLVPLGVLVKLSIDMIIKSLERLVPMTGEIAVIGNSLGKLGTAVSKVASNGKAAASGLTAMAMSFTILALGAQLVQTAIMSMAMSMGPSMSIMVTYLRIGSVGFQQFAVAVIASMAMMNAGLNASANQAQATARRLGLAVGTMLVVSIIGSYGSVYSASVGLGNQMIAGMNRGLQNGSASVSYMAARVARTALNSAKSELGVASPSKEFTKIGEWSDQGLVNGLLNGMGKVDKAGTQVGAVALSAVQKSLSEIKNSVMTDMDFTPTIRPVFDMTEIQNGAKKLNGLLTPPTLSVGDSYSMASTVSAQHRAMAAVTSSDTDSKNNGSGDTYIQNNYSPKPISRAELYRNTKNLISIKKGENPT